MKILAVFLGLISLFGFRLCLGAAEAQASVPQGFISWNLQSGQSRIIGAPLTGSSVYQGVVTQVTQDTVSVSGAPWTPDEFSGSHLVHFLTGSQEGRFLEIVCHGGGVLTLKVTAGASLTQPGDAVAMGDEFEIAPLETLDTLFGAAKEELVLQGGSRETADFVALFIEGVWVDYLFDEEAGEWRPLDAAHDLASPPPIVPGTPIRVTRRGPDKRLLLFGVVPTSAASLQLQNEETPFGWPFPIDQPLKDLTIKGPATWERSSTAEGADWLVEAAGDQSYFQLPTGSWAKAGSTSAGEFKLPAGGGFSLVKKTWPVPLKFHSLPLPYSLAPGAPPAQTPGSQTISLQLPTKLQFTTAAISLPARASSGLPVTFLVSGPARVSGSKLYLTGLGQVAVIARQLGNDAYVRASDVVRRMSVVDSIAPVISKLPRSVSTTKSSLRIYGAARDNYRVQSLRFRIKNPNGRLSSYRNLAIRSNSGSQKAFSIPVSMKGSGRYEIQVQVVDVSGNKSSLKKIRVTKR